MSDSSAAVMPKGEASAVPSWASKHILDSTNNNHSRCVFLDRLYIRLFCLIKSFAFLSSDITFSALQERHDEHNGTLTTGTPHAGCCGGSGPPPSLGLSGGSRRGRRVADDGGVHGGRGSRRCRGRQRRSRGRRDRRRWRRSRRRSGTASGARAGTDASSVRDKSAICHLRHGGLHPTYR